MSSRMISARLARRQTGGNGSPTRRLQHPNLVATNAVMEQTVLELRDKERPENTSKTMDGKIEEYFDYCDRVYPTDDYRYLLCYERVYRFMYYQAFRESKPPGLSKEAKAKRDRGEWFDMDEYNSIISNYVNHDPALGILSFPQPKKPIGVATFDMYKACLRKVYKVQMARNSNSLTWDAIWLLGLDELHNHVKERAPKVARESYKEKVNGEFSPYGIVEHYPALENCSFRDSNTRILRSLACGLRHRFCLLFLVSGVLRSESLHRAELSDFLGVSCPKLQTDVHDLYLMIMQIAIGKTTHGTMQYGRATRHKDVCLCAIGALAFYLAARFHITGEFLEFTLEDWADNKKWFDIKLLVDVNGCDRTRTMKNDSYSDHIKKILGELKLSCNKILHLERNLGAKLLDLLQEETKEIQRMGQWSQGVFDRSYSSKLPMAPIRKLAGYHDSKFYYCTRTAVVPSEELLGKTPFAFATWAYNGLAESIEPGNCPTAIAFLRFLMELNKVFLQDAAAMMVLHPQREQHGLFQELPVFTTPEFKEYKNAMAEALSTAKDPIDASLETVVPGLQRWQVQNNDDLKLVHNTVKELKSVVANGFDRLERQQDVHQDQNRRELSATLIRVAQQLLQVSESDANDPLLRAAGLLAESDQLTGHQESPLLEESPHQLAVASPAGAEDCYPLDTPEDHAGYRMKARHLTLKSLWEEWYGIGDYVDNYGGISGRDEQHGAKWRKHLNNMQYSRTKRVIQAIEKHMSINSQEWEAACVHLQTAYDASKHSVSNFVRYCQDNGLLSKRKPRGKHGSP